MHSSVCSSLLCIRDSWVSLSQSQNRRQTVVNRGALRLCGGGLTFEFDKKSTNTQCFIIQFGGAKPTNNPP